MDVNSEIFERISDKRRRTRYLSNQIRLGLSFQMRSLRKERNLTQKQLAELIGTKQAVISRIENHNADRLSIPTLIKIAEVLDVGIIVRFEEIDTIVDWYENMSPAKLAPRSTKEILESLTENGAKQLTKGKLLKSEKFASAPVSQVSTKAFFTLSGLLTEVPTTRKEESPTISSEANLSNIETKAYTRKAS